MCLPKKKEKKYVSGSSWGPMWITDANDILDRDPTKEGALTQVDSSNSILVRFK